MTGRTMRRRLLALAGASILGQVALGADEERPVDAFSKLRVQSGIDVVLTQAQVPRLYLESEGDLDDVESSVVGGELRITRVQARGLRSRFASADVTARVDFVDLSELAATGGADVSSSSSMTLESLRLYASGGSDISIELRARELDVELHGGADLRVEGTVDVLRIRASGGSDLVAAALDSREVRARLSAGSDAEIRAVERVDIEVRGGSDVVVHGDPQSRSVDADRSSDVTWR